MNLLAFPAAFGLFALGLALLFAGLFLGFGLKEPSDSGDSFSTTDLSIMGVAFVLIGLALYSMAQGASVPTVIFALAATFCSGVLWGKSDLSAVCANGVRWF